MPNCSIEIDKPPKRRKRNKKDTEQVEQVETETEVATCENEKATDTGNKFEYQPQN